MSLTSRGARSGSFPPCALLNILKKAGEVVVWGSLGSETRTFYHRHHSGRGRLLFFFCGGEGKGKNFVLTVNDVHFLASSVSFLRGRMHPPIPTPVCVCECSAHLSCSRYLSSFNPFDILFGEKLTESHGFRTARVQP